MTGEQAEKFRERVRSALLDRARRDPRPDVLEGVAEIYRHEAAIYARAYDTVRREDLEAIVDTSLDRARKIQRKRGPIRASDLLEEDTERGSR